MADGRLAAAREALDRLIGRLDPQDSLGVVAFDEVQVVAPAGPLVDKEAVRRRVRELEPGGLTNLSGGYLRGVQEARRASSDRGASSCCSPTAWPTRA